MCVLSVSAYALHVHSHWQLHIAVSIVLKWTAHLSFCPLTLSTLASSFSAESSCPSLATVAFHITSRLCVTAHNVQLLYMHPLRHSALLLALGISLGSSGRCVGNNKKCKSTCNQVTDWPSRLPRERKKRRKGNENGHKPSRTALLDREDDRSNMEITGATFARFEGAHDDGSTLD